MTGTSEICHATTISIDGQGVLLSGPSGAGKSGLALQLIALGAGLVADDRTEIYVQDGRLCARCPAPLIGLIEARCVGILNVPYAGPTPIALHVDLGQKELSRLPEPGSIQLLGVEIPSLRSVPAPHFAAAVLLYIKGAITSGA